MNGGGDWIADLACATIDGALKSTVLIAASAAWLRLAHPADARVRSRIWVVTLLASVTIPLAGAILPARGPGWLPPAVAAHGPMRIAVQPAEPVGSRSQAVADLRKSPPQSVASREAVRDVGPRSPSGVIGWPAAWATLWGVVAAALLVRRLGGLLRLRRLARQASVDDGEIARDPLHGAAVRIGVDAVPDLVVSDDVAGPATFGWCRPVILLPRVAMEWSAERLDVVLRHELAHVRRGDWIVRQALYVACALYWFQPLAWFVARRVAVEQELACDRDVVDSGTRPSVYALHLLEIARTAARSDVPPVPALQMARPSRMEDRLMAVLDDRTPARSARQIVPAIALTVLLVPVLGAVRTWSGSPTDDRHPTITVGEAEVADGSNRVRIGELATEMAASAAAVEAVTDRIEALVEAEIEPIVAAIERTIQDRLGPSRVEIDTIAARMEPIVRSIEEIHAFERADTLESIELLAARIAEADAEDGHDEAERRRLEAELRRLELDLRPDENEIREFERELRLHEEAMRELQESLRPMEDEIEALAAGIEPSEARLREIEESLRPHERRLGQIAEEMQARVVAEIHAIVAREAGLEGVRSMSAIAEAASAIARGADLDTDGGYVTLSISRARVRQIVADAFDGELSEAAADHVAAAVSDFRAP